MTVSGGLVLGVGMALVLNATFPARNLLRSVMLIPWGMAPVAVGILWSWIFDGSYGTLNALLFDLGLTREPIAWLANGSTAFNLVALVQVWNQAPLTALLVLAALQSMPENLHRAARIDGAGAVERFFKITLPWLRPMLLLIMLLTSINSIMAFDLFWIMTKGGPGSATTVFSWMGYSYAFQLSKFGEGAAILYILTIVCLLLAWVYLKLFTATERRPRAPIGQEALPAVAILERDSRAKTRLIKLPEFRRRTLLSGRARRIAGQIGLAAAAIFIFLWSFGPFLWLVLMSLSPSVDLVRTPPTLIPTSLTLENYRFVLFPGGVADGQGSVQATRVPYAIWNSLVVAVCVTAINLILGSLAGYAYARHGKGRLMNGSLWALMMTRMTPSLALILPFFIVFRSVGLIDTRTALVIAYCSLILPALDLDDEGLLREPAAQPGEGGPGRRLHAVPGDLENHPAGGAARDRRGRHLLLPGELERVRLRPDPHRLAQGADHPRHHRRLPGAASLLRLRPDVRGERAGRHPAGRHRLRIPALSGARHALGLPQSASGSNPTFDTLAWRRR